MAEPKQGAGPYSIGSGVWPGLSKLIEEAGELMQVAGKLLGTGGAIDHWDGTNLKLRLEEEMADVLAACQFVAESCGLDLSSIIDRRIHKIGQFQKWHSETPR